ncbi:hypothetical protein V1512DRAFT_245638 [Lipomyces arxii]|uniref:uncharacterized protein n=1 Tax=Lipomyces arxii TaxID=56418 RepID=UPI0034CE1763
MTRTFYVGSGDSSWEVDIFLVLQEFSWFVKPVTSDDFPETAADESVQDGSAERFYMALFLPYFTLAALRNIRDLEPVLQIALPIQSEFLQQNSNVSDN